MPTISPVLRARQRPFDYTSIDTPEEALLLPVGEPVEQLAGSPGWGQQTRVSLRVGDQSVDYTVRPTTGGHEEIRGSMNGKPFQLDMIPQQSSWDRVVEGTTPGGAISGRMTGLDSGFTLSGRAGEVELQETARILSEYSVEVHGLIGGEKFRQVLTVGPGEKVRISGHLGDRRIEETTRTSPDGTLTIEGSIGDVSFQKEIRFERTGS